MQHSHPTLQSSPVANVRQDLIAGLVVFLIAVPLCLGIALASNAPPIAGLIAGIVGGLLVGSLSGSHTSVAGPAAGLTAVVAMEIGKLGAFEAFLVAVVLAGVIQIVLGICRAGFIAAFFPSSVIKGLLAAIGVIIILKQIPHLLGRDMDPMGEKSFLQPDGQNTFSELMRSLLDVHAGALVVSIISILLMVFWDRIKFLKRTQVPSALVVVLLGVGLVALFRQIGGSWLIEASHLVAVPVAAGPLDFVKNGLIFPDWNALAVPSIYVAAITIALVASLETLLNIEAVDKLDPEQRSTPPNRELIAQGVGNVAAGLIGGLPMTSVVIRSSVNINAGAKTKLSAITHGALILACVALVPAWLNQIPLAALAAILFLTGLKLASPKLIKQMWQEGTHQFVPFAVTVLAIVFTDLLIGVLIGLGVSVLFILHSNFRRPLTKVLEQHISGDVLRVELANQVSFFSKPALEQTLREVPKGGHILLDARNTDYIDPDVLDFITDFKNTTAAAHDVKLSLTGFKDRYPRLQDEIQYVDFTSREVQSELTPQRVLTILKDGNARFRTGHRLTRDLGRQVDATAAGQFPMAVILSCIDSRTPAELIFDLGLGDIFSVRIAGNIARDKVLGSIEYSCAVAGAKVVLVMGHTSCGAVNAAVDLLVAHKTAAEATGCVNLDSLIAEIQQSVDPATSQRLDRMLPEERAAYANEVARRNVLRTMRKIRERSTTLDAMVSDGKLAIVGALYDVRTGSVDFFQTGDSPLETLSVLTVAGV